MRQLAALLALLWLALAGPVLAQGGSGPAFPDRGTAPVLDQANIIDDATEAALTQRLLAFETANQRQFVIVTLNSLDGYEISDYGYQLGRHWALGDAEENDGIILIVAPNERAMRIEVGYGLEGTMPDGLAFDIVEEMKPFFRANDFSGGIAHGADRIIRQLELPPDQAAEAVRKAEAAQRSDGGIPAGALIWLAILFFFFILPMLRGRGRKRRYRGGGMGDVARDIILWEAGKAIIGGMASDDDHWGGGWGGGGFGGGGGFSGGGGSFGGGGASGSW